MSNEINELTTLLDQTNRQLKSFNDSLSRNVRSDTIYQNSINASTEATKDNKETQQQFSKTMAGTISGLTGFTKTLANGQGSFAPLTAVISLTTKALGKLVGGIPFVGKALKGLAEGAGEVANHMIESFDKAYGTFEKLSDSGVVTTFESMRISAHAMQLNFAQTETVLTKHSKNLALFAGSAVKGRQEFEKMAVNSYDVRRSFQKLGVSGEDFSEMQLSYLNQQMRSGQGQKKSTEELTAGSIEYIKQLDAISKLTGVSKKELQSEREARMGDARYRAGVADLPGHIKDEADALLDMIKSTGATATKQGIQDLIASDGVATSKAAQDVLNQYAGSTTELLAIIQGIKSGSMKGASGFDKLTELADKSAVIFKDQVSQRGTDIATGKLYAETTAIAVRKGKDSQKALDAYKKEQDDIIKNTDSVNSQLAETKQSLEHAQRDIELMSTSGKLITGLMKHLASGIEDITFKFYKMSGEELPAHLKAREEEKEALKEEQEALQAVKDAEQTILEHGKISGRAGRALSIVDEAALMYAQSQLQKASKKAQQASRKKIEADEAAGFGGAAAAQGTAQTGVVGMTNSPSDYDGLNIGGKYPGEAIAGGPASKNLIELARKFQGKYPGGKFSAFNDETHKSGKHTKGLAFDYTLGQVGKNGKIPQERGMEIVQFLRNNGASMAIDEYNNPSEYSTGGHIHAEVSARTGGIFSGPDSGYLAELHGDEAVAKVGDSKSVSQSALGSGSMMTGGSSIKISEIYSNLSEKMDTLIDLMDISMENQKKFLEAKLN